MKKGTKNEDVALLKVQVTAKLPLAETRSVSDNLRAQGVTCGLAYCGSNEYEVWRQALPDDEPRKKNSKHGMTPHGVIESAEDIEQRDFVVVWYKDDILYLNKKSVYAITQGVK